MRKQIWLILALTLALGWVGQALAAPAGTPVYLEGQLVTRAVERQGVTYLPVREFCELLGAKVAWQETARQVAVTFPDGSVLKLQVGSAETTLDKPDDSRTGFAPLENPPFMSGGVVYLPLRFIAQEVLGFEVAYQDGAVRLAYPMLDKGEYRLNLYTGELWQGEQLLGRLTIPGYTYNHTYRVYTLDKVVPTAAGNYLITASGICSGALTYSMNYYCWLNPQSGQTVWDVETALAANELTGINAGAGIVYFPGRRAGGVVCIDEASGQVHVMEGLQSFLWQQGDWVLSGNLSGYELYNMATGERRELTEQLVTPALKERVNQFLQSNNPRLYAKESVFTYFWDNLGNTIMFGMMEDVPYLEFVGARDGRLEFCLCCRYVKQTEHEVYTDVERFPIYLEISALGI